MSLVFQRLRETDVSRCTTTVFYDHQGRCKGAEEGRQGANPDKVAQEAPRSFSIDFINDLISECAEIAQGAPQAFSMHFQEVFEMDIRRRRPSEPQ